jgi:hypothetical protein
LITFPALYATAWSFPNVKVNPHDATRVRKKERKLEFNVPNAMFGARQWLNSRGIE